MDQPVVRQCDDIARLLEAAIIEQLSEAPCASVLQVARQYLRDNGYVAASRPDGESPLRNISDYVRMPFPTGTST